MNPTHPNWLCPPSDLTLGSNEIHVWRASLDLEPCVLSKLRATLSQDESTRADRFVFDADRCKYVAARGILRHLLGIYSGLPSNRIQFSYGPEGKPELTQGQGPVRLRFNLSHSNSVAILAFALESELGVDVEQIKQPFGGEEIAERYFSPREVSELRALPPELRAEGFFLGWTRKEAYVKAQGAGLQFPLHSFDVSLTPGQPATLQTHDSSGWSIYSFEPGPGYAAALVGEKKAKEFVLRYLEWHSSLQDL